MPGLFHTFIVRHLLQNLLRSSLTLIGIALGVGILLAITLANHTALQQFQNSLDSVTGQTNLDIRPVGQWYLQESLLARLRPLWKEGGQFTAVLEQTAVLLPSPGEVLTVVGLDLLAEPDFQQTLTPVSSLKDNETPQEMFRLFLPRQVLVSESLAKAHHWRIKSRFNALVNDRQETFTVAGTMPDTGMGRAYGGRLMVMDLSMAQEAFQAVGQLSRIDLKVPESALTRIQGELSVRLGPSVVVERPSRRGEQAQKILRAFQANLTALSFVSLLVGMFLIYNTMSISVLRLRPEIATLRTLGLSQKSVLGLFIGEALLLGSLGSALGVGLGVWMAQGAVVAVSKTVETMYLNQSVTRLLIDPWILAGAFTLGMILTLLAALPPALEAATVAPALATRRDSGESRVRQWAKPMAWAGLGLGIIAYGLSWLPPVDHLPVFGFAAALLIVLSGAATLPWVLQRLFWLLDKPMVALLGAPGRIAIRSLQGTLGRTAVATASLMVGIAMMISLAVMIDSFRHTVIAWVNQTIRADLWIQPASRANSRLSGRLSPQVVQRLRQMPEVEGVDDFLEFPMEYRGETTNLAAGQLELLGRHGSLLMTDGESIQTVLKRMRGEDAALITESFALRFGTRRGDRVTLHTPTGDHPVTIAGVYYDYSSERGYLVLPRSLYQRYYHDDTATNLAIYLKPGQNSATVRDRIHAVLGTQKGIRLTITTNRELREEVLRIFDNTFSITYVLHLIAIAVALLGVMNTLFALVLESRREFGILRYIGASMGQVRQIVFYQAGLLGLFGNLSGFGVGMLLALLLVYVVNRQSFGWTIQLSMPWGFLGQSAALVMVTAIVSAILPARLASRIVAPQVIREE